ncbi:MAG: hypothetical protein K2X32_11165 [Phycisphaerales bacterium]|nr:hypothetical protein [Phycisphaerales bacterium]
MALGVLGAEAWLKLVDADTPAPTDRAALTFLTMTTKPSFRAPARSRVQGGRGRQNGGAAVSMARWVNTRGEKGPWPKITTARV